MSRFIVLFLFTLFLVPHTAQGQALVKDNDVARAPVLERQYEGFVPQGLKLGAFTLRTNTTLEAFSVSNLFLTPTNEESDLGTALKPEFILESEWSEHALKVTGNGEILRYRDNNSEDQNNGSIEIEGRYDVSKKTSLYNRLVYARDHENRTDILNTLAPSSPFRFKDLSLVLGTLHKSGKYLHDLSAEHRRVSFDNEVTRSNPNQLAVRSDADRSENTLAYKLSYDLRDDLKALLALSYRQLSFERRSFSQVTNNFTGVKPDSEQVTAAIGLDDFITPNIKGSVLVGVTRQEFDDNQLDTVTNSIAGVNLAWNPTPLGTLRFGYDRRVLTDNEILGGFTQDNLLLAYDHELRRNIILTTEAEFNRRDFENQTREDDTIRFGVNADYMLGENYALGFNINYLDRESNVASANFDQTIFMLNLTHRF